MSALGRQSLGEPLQEQRPVAEPRQDVVISLVSQPFLQIRQLGERAAELAVLEGDRRMIGERDEQLQVLCGRTR